MPGRPASRPQLLKARLDAVPDGGLIVMIAPPNPYRCPPGPYERVSMMAHVLKAAGKTKAKIVIIDPKEAFSKQPLFMEGWTKHYPGMVEWLGPKIHEGVKSVDPKTNTVVTGFETYKAALVNVIPAQMAGKIARDAGLANQSGFCPIDPTNMKSTSDPSIYVVGDACIPGDMPKSAFAANSQAKVAAMMVRGELAKAQTFPARYANTCWSLIETDDTVKIGGRYEAKDGKIAQIDTFVSKTWRDPGTAQRNPAGKHRLVLGDHCRHLQLSSSRTRPSKQGPMISTNGIRHVRRACLAACACLIAGVASVAAQEATFSIKQLTPETALKLAQATLEACRKEGFQVAVAVTDRSGVAQVLLRDRFAGPHTVTVAIDKAWTAASFRQDTLALARATADPAHAGLRHFDRVVAVGGGVPIEAGGSILGALGVSGGPGGEVDDRCARSGLEADPKRSRLLSEARSPSRSVDFYA